MDGGRIRERGAERVKFFGEAFFQKSFDLELDLMGVSQKETSDRGGRARKGDSHGSGR